MAFLRLAFLIFYIILVSNVTLYQSTDNNGKKMYNAELNLKILIKYIKNVIKENVMEESTYYALQEPHRYLINEENGNFSEKLRDEV